MAVATALSYAPTAHATVTGTWSAQFDPSGTPGTWEPSYIPIGGNFIIDATFPDAEDSSATDVYVFGQDTNGNTPPQHKWRQYQCSSSSSCSWLTAHPWYFDGMVRSSVFTDAGTDTAKWTPHEFEWNSSTGDMYLDTTQNTLGTSYGSTYSQGQFSCRTCTDMESGGSLPAAIPFALEPGTDCNSGMHGAPKGTCIVHYNGGSWSQWNPSSGYYGSPGGAQIAFDSNAGNTIGPYFYVLDSSGAIYSFLAGENTFGTSPPVSKGVCDADGGAALVMGQIAVMNGYFFAIPSTAAPSGGGSHVYTFDPDHACWDDLGLPGSNEVMSIAGIAVESWSGSGPAIYATDSAGAIWYFTVTGL
jgi:hypothetical protein